MRLGELLIEAGVTTAAQVDRALGAQVMLGGRIGTCLVELGIIDLDGLANALGYQLGFPAALSKHFEHADPGLQASLRPELAERFMAIPLQRVGKRAAAVAIGKRLEPRSLAILAEELAVTPDRLILAIAPELRIRYALEVVYRIARPARFLRAPGSAQAPPTKVTLAGREAEILDGLELADPPPPARRRSDTGDRRRYLRTVADAAPIAPPAAPPARAAAMPGQASATQSVLAAIETSDDREQLARLTTLAVEELVPTTEVAMMLALRGAVAVNMSGGVRRDGHALDAIAIPTDQPGLISAALRTRATVHAGSDALTEIDRRLVSAMGLEHAELVVTPVVSAARIMALLVVATRTAPDAELIGEIARAAGKCLAQLIRSALE
jgi:hypothetical protein